MAPVPYLAGEKKGKKAALPFLLVEGTKSGRQAFLLFLKKKEEKSACLSAGVRQEGAADC